MTSFAPCCTAHLVNMSRKREDASNAWDHACPPLKHFGRDTMKRLTARVQRRIPLASICQDHLAGRDADAAPSATSATACLTTSGSGAKAPHNNTERLAGRPPPTRRSWLSTLSVSMYVCSQSSLTRSPHCSVDIYPSLYKPASTLGTSLCSSRYARRCAMPLPNCRVPFTCAQLNFADLQ